MVEGSCHCGAVRLEVAAAPTRLTSCNCSICRRLGALWAYYRPSEVTVAAASGATVPYVQGDKTLATHHCATCGCTTHWEPLDRSIERMAINARLLDPAAIEGVPVRRFDGADTWTFLD